MPEESPSFSKCGSCSKKEGDPDNAGRPTDLVSTHALPQRTQPVLGSQAPLERDRKVQGRSVLKKKKSPRKAPTAAEVRAKPNRLASAPASTSGKDSWWHRGGITRKPAGTPAAGTGAQQCPRDVERCVASLENWAGVGETRKLPG